MQADSGDVKWAENANVGVMPQDTSELFPNDDLLMDWMNQWRNTGDDDQVIRGTLGRLLFSGDDISKSVKVLSGGEKGRMIWGKLMLVSALANRILEVKMDGSVVDYSGTYEEYLRSQSLAG
jgi:ATPase subunit of ABC transporter with duplicated ATPase domains